MNFPAAVSATVDDREHRRNALILAIAAAVSGAIPPVLFTLGGLAGMYLLGPDKSLATLPLSAFTVGVALGAFPAAMLMRAVGRRLGFPRRRDHRRPRGDCQRLCRARRIVRRVRPCRCRDAAFPLPSLSNTASPRRTAAARPSRRRRSRGCCRAASPRRSSARRPRSSPATFSRRFRLPGPSSRPPGSRCSASWSSPSSGDRRGCRRTRRSVPAAGRSREIARQPRFIVAVLCAMGAYSHDEPGHDRGAARHGRLRPGRGQRRPRHPVARPGDVRAELLLGRLDRALRRGARSSPSASSSWRPAPSSACPASRRLISGVAIILLGIGWNFGFVGATAMVTATYRPEERRQGPGIERFPRLRRGRARLALVGQAVQHGRLDLDQPPRVPDRPDLRAGVDDAAFRPRGRAATRP